MKSLLAITLGFLLVTGCTSSPRTTGPNAGLLPGSSNPNWDEVDKTVRRVRDRERTKLQAVETERTVESGFFAMTDDEYTAALEAARSDVRKANPKMSDADVETEATKRADEAKRRHETTFSRRASSTYELKRP